MQIPQKEPACQGADGIFLLHAGNLEYTAWKFDNMPHQPPPKPGYGRKFPYVEMAKSELDGLTAENRTERLRNIISRWYACIGDDPAQKAVADVFVRAYTAEV